MDKGKSFGLCVPALVRAKKKKVTYHGVFSVNHMEVNMPEIDSLCRELGARLKSAFPCGLVEDTEVSVVGLVMPDAHPHDWERPCIVVRLRREFPPGTTLTTDMDGHPVIHVIQPA